VEPRTTWAGATPAIERKRHPRDWTHENIAQMRGLLTRLKLSYDWEREVTTCEPDYYRHEQEMFLSMLEHGLACRKHALANLVRDVRDGARERSSRRTSCRCSATGSAAAPAPTSPRKKRAGGHSWRPPRASTRRKKAARMRK
jgi:hypothetical protein